MGFQLNMLVRLSLKGETNMVSLVQARVRIIRLYLSSEVEEGKIDWFRVIKIGSGILIGWWLVYVLLWISALAGMVK